MALRADAAQLEPAHGGDVIKGTPLSVFLDFDPQVKFPRQWAWKKETRIPTGSRNDLRDLARAAERQVSDCQENLPEYPYGSHMCITMAWNANSEDGARPDDIVADHFQDGDTLVVYGTLYKKDEHGKVPGHDHDAAVAAKPRNGGVRRGAGTATTPQRRAERPKPSSRQKPGRTQARRWVVKTAPVAGTGE